VKEHREPGQKKEVILDEKTKAREKREGKRREMERETLRS